MPTATAYSYSQHCAWRRTARKKNGVGGENSKLLLLRLAVQALAAAAAAAAAAEIREGIATTKRATGRCVTIHNKAGAVDVTDEIYSSKHSNTAHPFYQQHPIST